LVYSECGLKMSWNTDSYEILVYNISVIFLGLYD